MPNWVFIEMTVTGKEEAVRNFREKLSMPLEQQDGTEAASVFNFEALLPVPKELNISSGSLGNWGLAVLSGDIDRMLTYPWVVEGLTKHNLPATQEGLKSFFKTTDPEVLVQGQQYLDNIGKHGVPTWYEWCVENWGTKWNACDAALTEVSATRLDYRFDTAWSLPVPLLEKLCAEFPDVEIEGSYDEESRAFRGSFLGKKGKFYLSENDEPYDDEVAEET